MTVRAIPTLVAGFTRPQEQRPKSLSKILELLELDWGVVIFAGAGSGLLLVPKHRAEEVSDAIEGALKEATHGDLSTAAAHLLVWPQDLGLDDGSDSAGQPEQLDSPVADFLAPPLRTSAYARTLAALYAVLDQRRAEIIPLPQKVPATRQLDRCQACWSRPATETRARGDDQERVCKPCLDRGQAAGELKRIEQARTTYDLFPEEDQHKRRLAVLYVDGANFGGAFAQVSSPIQHRALSLAVEDAFAQALKDSLKNCGIHEGRYQTPIRGGDDLVILLSAHHAFHFVRLFVPAVEQHLSLEHHPFFKNAFSGSSQELKHALDKLGVGVGIAIADETFPDRLLLRYAKELLTSAKKVIHEKKTRSAVDFLVLRSGNPLNGSIDQLRQDHFQRAAGEKGQAKPALHLTQRPYAFADLCKFLDQVEHLARRVPTSQLHAVQRAVDAGYHESRSFFRYQNARDSKADSQSGWSAYRRARGVSLAQVDQLLWQKREDGVLTTDYLDAVEVQDLLNFELEAAHEDLSIAG